MSLEDPFFVVKDEVQRAVQTARTLYQRWRELVHDPAASRDELDWTSNELRNSLRSIEWDLEDLDETISIVEKNPKKFKIDLQELADRKGFVQRTKSTVQEMRDHLASPQPKAPDKVPKGAHHGVGPARAQNRYMRLENEIERDNQKFIEDTAQQQKLMMTNQDDQIDMIGNTVTNLKHMSSSISNELDEQATMLDDLGHEMDTTDTKMDSVMKKMAKMLHMSNDKRQWCAIGVLLVIMIIVIVLFFTI